MPRPPAPQRGLRSQRPSSLGGECRTAGHGKPACCNEAAVRNGDRTRSKNLCRRAPQRQAPAEPLDEPRVILEGAREQPRSGGHFGQDSLETFRIIRGGNGPSRCDPAQVAVGKQIDAKWLQTGPQRRPSRRPCAGANDDHLVGHARFSQEVRMILLADLSFRGVPNIFPELTEHFSPTGEFMTYG